MFYSSIFLVLFLVSSVPSSEASCAPSCKGTGVVDGSRVPDPNNCHYYYICLDNGLGLEPTPVSFPCPDGTDFDALSRMCTDPSSPNFMCDKSCFNCKYYCSEKDIIADPWDCGTYYHCTEGLPSQGLPCPAEKPYFDGDACQSDATRCCSCISYCSQADRDRLVSDVFDCTSYYFCNKVGPAEPYFHSTCPVGNFDYIHQRCSETYPCFEQCSSGRTKK
ncbi:uncharacterized protein LOC125036228 [Penaeus chinensis]|uniref:uncharacterized protein LOC125036228 n=1 Tax=Penaeus chinensis TaxID=139456 RepID=UPI001FB79E57|nr:uncharacterized protein LOC125036228 [Penaeus chinensis]